VKFDARVAINEPLVGSDTNAVNVMTASSQPGPRFQNGSPSATSGGKVRMKKDYPHETSSRFQDREKKESRSR